MEDMEVLAIAKVYTNQTVIGMGALKGASCQILSVADNGDGSQTMTFKWEDSTGTSHTTPVVLPSAIIALTNPQNGQTLKYNSTLGKFENSNTAFSANLEDLEDVTITTVQNGQVLQYDSATGKWINATMSVAGDLADLGDVTIASVSNGQVLAYDGTENKWANLSLGTAALKDSTNAVTEDDTDLVESGAVYTAIDDAVKALDVSDSAVAGSYVTAVAETDGKISVTREAADASPTASSKKMVESGGVYTAIDDAVKALDVTDAAVAGSYVTAVAETDGKISVTREAADAAPTASSKKMVESGGVYTAIDDAVKALDVTDAAVAGSYVTAVAETDGKVSVTREAADTTPTANSKKMLTSGGAKTALDAKVDSISVNGTAQTITNSAVDLDVASELITPTQWTALSTLYS